ncbi:MAG: serine/threonine protein kinase [Lachnospiraceae bacterium]|nr:serine/threonine protein kinase [Lachnospiraceae bacterium]
MVFGIGECTSQEFPCEIVSKISGGHMAEIYLARLRNTEHRVVVKAVGEAKGAAQIAGLETEISLQRKQQVLTREARVLSGLRLEGIPEFYGYFEESARRYFIMSYHTGINLEQKMLAQGKMSEAEVREIILKVCRILTYLHRKGVVYGDLKPSNLLIEPMGGMVLVDYGMAVEMAEIRKEKAFRGTLGYAPPECWHLQQKLSPATDVFSLGVTLFYLLEGQNPGKCYGHFVLSEKDVQKKNRWQPVLDKCCALDSTKRYQSAAEVFEAVSKISL